MSDELSGMSQSAQPSPNASTWHTQPPDSGMEKNDMTRRTIITTLAAAELAREREAYKQLLLDHENAMAHVENVDAELARVKAESLRVVKVGKACEISKIAICGCFIFNGTVFRMYSFSREEFGAWQLSDHTEHLFAPNTIVQPVRLERWEDSNEH